MFKICVIDPSMSPGHLRHQTKPDTPAGVGLWTGNASTQTGNKYTDKQIYSVHGERHHKVTWGWTPFATTMNCISHFEYIKFIYISDINFKCASWKGLPSSLCVLWGKFTLVGTSSAASSRGLPPELPNRLFTLLPGLKLATPTTATTTTQSLSPGNCDHRPSFHSWHKSYLLLLRFPHIFLQHATSKYYFLLVSTTTTCHKSLTPMTLFAASDLWSLSQSVRT